MGAAPYNTSPAAMYDGAGNLLPPTGPPTFTPPPTANILSTTAPNPFVPNGTYPPNAWTYPGGSLALNDSTEMKLYGPTELDEPFNPSDLEWLYRKQDIDGGSLSSRLPSLAPVSVTNTLASNGDPRVNDGVMRSRMLSTEVWDLNNFAMGANPLIGSSYLDYTVNILNTRNVGGGNAVPINQVGLSIAHRDRRINLNYPLPTLQDLPPGVDRTLEPVRQKWIRETYELCKRIVPTSTIRTPEQLAQLSQYVVNIIDFRDPDDTCTQFVNTDILVTAATPTQPPTLSFRDPGSQPLTAFPYDPTNTPPAGFTYMQQFGMEYPAVAINEVLAYSFLRKDATTSPPTPRPTPRMFIELVNTLTRDGNTQPAGGTASDLPLTGWDMVIMEDDGLGRPDPFTGQPSGPAPLARTWPIMLNPAKPRLLAREADGLNAMAPSGLLLLRHQQHESRPSHHRDEPAGGGHRHPRRRDGHDVLRLSAATGPGRSGLLLALPPTPRRTGQPGRRHGRRR